MFKSNLKISLCRTCLATLLHSNFYNIHKTLDLAMKLMLCSGQQVEITDEYPENVCRQCYEKIISFCEFQEMCCKSLTTFNKLIKENKCLKEDGTVKNKNASKDPLNDEREFLNPLAEQYIDLSSCVQTCSKSLKKKKRSSSTKKNLKFQMQETKTVIKNTTRSTKRETPTKDHLEELQFDNKSLEYSKIEDFATRKDSLTREVYNNLTHLNVPDISGEHNYNMQKEESPTDTYSSVSEHELTTCAESISPQRQEQECDRCSRSFKSLSRLQAHERKHDGLPPYTCTFGGCELIFDDWCFYNKHRKEHDLTEDPTFKCDIDNCERVYKSKSNLNIHKRKFHNVGPQLRTHMCEFCGKVFNSPAALTDHHYTHIDRTQLPYACEEEGCHKRFSNKEKLKIHKMRHAGIKNFICPYCGMRKTTRNELKIHINYHTLEKTWPCRFCPKVCNSAGNLKMHVKSIHERAKDFACRFCERTFAKADTKKYHEMTHTGEKPHECKDCGRRFIQPAALRTHRKIHLRQNEKVTGSRKYKQSIATEEMPSTVENIVEPNLVTESIAVEI